MVSSVILRPRIASPSPHPPHMFADAQLPPTAALLPFFARTFYLVPPDLATEGIAPDDGVIPILR